MNTAGSYVVPYAWFLYTAQAGSFAASGDAYVIAWPSSTSLTCRSIAELHITSAEPCPDAASAMKRLYISVEFMSLYSTLMSG